MNWKIYQLSQQPEIDRLCLVQNEPKSTIPAIPTFNATDLCYWLPFHWFICLNMYAFELSIQNRWVPKHQPCRRTTCADRGLNVSPIKRWQFSAKHRRSPFQHLGNSNCVATETRHMGAHAIMLCALHGNQNKINKSNRTENTLENVFMHPQSRSVRRRRLCRQIWNSWESNDVWIIHWLCCVQPNHFRCRFSGSLTSDITDYNFPWNRTQKYSLQSAIGEWIVMRYDAIRRHCITVRTH